MNSRNFGMVAFGLLLSIFLVKTAIALDSPSKTEQTAKEEKQKVAELAKKEKIALAEGLIAKAQQCDLANAESYAKVPGETADTLAAAAFDKCATEWKEASKATIDAQWLDINSFTQEEMNANPLLLISTINRNTDIANKFDVNAWREREIKRLRVVIIDARAKQIAR